MVVGISLIPNKGSQTQKIPPKTSVSERSVRSAAGKYFAFEEYKMRAEQTINPCNADNEVFFNDIKILLSLKNKNKSETLAAIIPPNDTVVSFGTFFLQRRETVNPAKAEDEINPLIKPNSVPVSLLSKDIKIIPEAAIIMANNVLFEIFSFKKIYASKAAIKGIAPNIIKVTAAVVVVIENTNEILAIPRHVPPIKPEKPIL